VTDECGAGTFGNVRSVFVQLPGEAAKQMAAKAAKDGREARLKLRNEALAGSAVSHPAINSPIGWLHASSDSQAEPWLLYEMADSDLTDLGL
jgi:hypothetical protein